MAKINDIRFLAREAAKEASSSPRDWMRYLDTACRLYRYPFSDTLLIHAQRPDATACAELEVWNEKMLRWVNRGAKGIALIDDTGPRRRLRYVFDITDTHPGRGGRTPYLWNIRREQRDIIRNHLIDVYGLDVEEKEGLLGALRAVSEELAADSLEEAMEGMGYALEGTYLEKLDADTIRTEFRILLENSAFYSLARRCGLEPMDDLSEEDFYSITDYRDLSVLSFLGNATSQLVEPVLRDIGRTVWQAEREAWQEKSAEKIQNPVEKEPGMPYNEFNTLIHESKNIEGGETNGSDVSPQGRLPVPEPGAAGGASDHREIRDAAEDISERTPEEPVPEPVDQRETGQPSDTDRENGPGEDGAIDGWTSGNLPGTGEGERPDGLDGTHEQPDSDGGRNHTEGIGLLLSEETTEQDLSEAEEEIASALSLPELPTVEKQMRSIEERQAALYAGDTAIPADVIDEVLRKGGNRSRSHLRIIHNFMIDQPQEAYTEFVRREYGTGGIGMVIGGKEYSVWYDNLGMQIAVGHTVTDRILDKTFLSWEEVSGRIHQLLKQGEYAPQSVLDAARKNALEEHAEALIYMKQDMAEGVAELVFPDMEMFRFGFPEATERLSALLEQPEYLADLNERLEGLAEVYEQDRDVMRFHHYRPDKVSAQFQKLAKEAVPYQAREGFVWEEHPVFITQDEVDSFLKGGGSYSDGRLCIYAFFIQDKSAKEKTDFLKKQYGSIGPSHALPGADDTSVDYENKGIRLHRGRDSNQNTELFIKWSQVAMRVQYLIDNNQYLKTEDYSRMPEYERENMARRVYGFYQRLPKEIERPYKEENFYDYGNSWKQLTELLEEPETAERLVAQMDAALAALPLDFEGYEERAETLSLIHQYIEGTYIMFPVKKQDIQVEGSGRQLSIFDFMGGEVTVQETTEEPESQTEAASVGETQREESIRSAPEETAESVSEEAAEEPEKATEVERSAEPSAEELSEEETDTRYYDAIEESLEAEFQKAGASMDDFSPEQMDVIYTAAEKGQGVTPVLNPEFSPEQMQLILNVLERLETDNQASVKRELEFLTTEVMSLDTINTIRQYYHIPLEPAESAETAQKGQEETAVGGAKPVNFRITDDSLGVGGPKEKFRANIQAVRLLHELELENRMATPEEQEILSRYVGWGGLSQAFEERSKDWSDEFIELYVELDPEEYREAKESTLNAFYTPPVVIKAMYEALEKMGLEKGNLLDKTTPRLIQFHTLKNAVNPPFLGGFLFSGTVAA